MPDRFDPPLNLEAAESLRDELAKEVQRIQSQLGDKQRTDSTGRRLSSKEYWAWRRQASHALTEKLDQLRQVKSWIRDFRRGGPVDEHPAVVHLRAMMIIIEDMEECDLDPDELAQVESCRDYLRSLSTPRLSSPSVK